MRHGRARSGKAHRDRSGGKCLSSPSSVLRPGRRTLLAPFGRFAIKHLPCDDGADGDSRLRVSSRTRRNRRGRKNAITASRRRYRTSPAPSPLNSRPVQHDDGTHAASVMPAQVRRVSLTTA